MPRAGYCSGCRTNVYLRTDGGCPNGHGPELISGVYDAPPPQPLTRKRCATCGTDYDAVYDRCPRCANAALGSEPAGNLVAAIGIPLGLVMVSSFAGAAVSIAVGSSDAALLTGTALAVIIGFVVFFDIRSLARPDVTGSAASWAVGVFLLMIVFLPLYIYKRPKYLWRMARRASWDAGN